MDGIFNFECKYFHSEQFWPQTSSAPSEENNTVNQMSNLRNKFDAKKRQMLSSPIRACFFFFILELARAKFELSHGADIIGSFIKKNTFANPCLISPKNRDIGRKLIRYEKYYNKREYIQIS